MDVDATTVVATVCLAATTIAVFGLLSYCSSSAVITMTVVAVVAMVCWAAITMAAAIGLSGLSCSPASVAITTAADATMAAANLSKNTGGVKAAHFKRLLLEYLRFSII